MVDYSRFDKIPTDDSDDEDQQALSNMSAISPPQPSVQSTPQTVQMTKRGTEGRLRFEYQGRTVYEWEQTLEDVSLYVKPPPGLQASMINCEIRHQHVTLGLRGNPPFLDEESGGPIKSRESYWMLEDDEIHIQLHKMNRGEMWSSALKGRGEQQMDPVTTEDVKKKLMLERFQEEHPGFDFSNAEFNGAVPNAQTFMGGVKYG